MNRLQLEHLIRAAGDIAGDDEIVILGSTAVLSQFPDVPEQIIHSVEADIFPKNKPEMASVIDGCIGELSPFHQTYGYYAHGVVGQVATNGSCLTPSSTNPIVGRGALHPDLQ